METSAYNGQNIHDAFLSSAEKIYTGIQEGIIDIYKVSFSLVILKYYIIKYCVLIMLILQENGIQYGSVVRSSPGYNNQDSGHAIIMFVVMMFIVLTIMGAVIFFYSTE